MTVAEAALWDAGIDPREAHTALVEIVYIALGEEGWGWLAGGA